MARSYETTLDLATVYQDRKWKRWLLDSVGARHGSILLDVGCGTCLLEESLEARGAEVVGLDLSDDMVRVGRGKGVWCADALLVGDAEELPFARATIVSTVSCYVAKYCEVEKFMGELMRVTKRGGKVALYDFTKPHGMALPALGVYEYGCLRVAGLLLGMARSGLAATFSELPGIIGKTTWDRETEDLCNRNGLAYERKEFAGGATTGFAVVKS